jgi:hypothetical protein
MLACKITKYSSLPIALLATLLLAGCGGSSDPPFVTLKLNPSEPQTLQVNQTLAVTTSVDKDPGGQQFNVTWTLTCVGACGTVIPNYTRVGESVVYTAPPNPPTGNVVLTANLLYGNAGPPASLTITVVP